MKKSIVVGLVISIACLIVGAVMIVVCLNALDGSYSYSFGTGRGFYYRMSYSYGDMLSYSAYYEKLFSLGELLFLSGVILITGTLISHNSHNNFERLRKEKIRKENVRRMDRVSGHSVKAEPVDIPVENESDIGKDDENVDPIGD